MSDQAFQWPIRVYYEDTDAGGVVYHSNYINFFERARTEWLRDLGFEQDTLRKNDQTVFVVRKVEAEYLKPALFNDEIIATASVEKTGRSSIELSQQILRGDEILTTGNVLVVCVDSESFKPKRIPAHILDTFSSKTA